MTDDLTPPPGSPASEDLDLDKVDQTPDPTLGDEDSFAPDDEPDDIDTDDVADDDVTPDADDDESEGGK